MTIGNIGFRNIDFRRIARELAMAVLEGFVNAFIPNRDPGQEPGIAPAKPPPLAGMKAERVQFWESLIDNAWRQEANGQALHRTILCDAATAARDLAKTVEETFSPCGYRPDAIEVLGNVLSVRLTTATVGQLTEQDYAAALMIDTCV